MLTAANQDTAWKDVLDYFFNAFVQYCLPKLFQLIDWRKSWESLDQELQAITRDTETGKRLLDKLFKVFLLDGREQWILVHVEIQGRKEAGFEQRMFTYWSRIFDKYQRQIVSCAILTDSNKNWHPNYFSTALAGCTLNFKFLTIKITDYLNRMEELESSNNPFASVILTQLQALQSKAQSNQDRKGIKFALTRRLYDRGFNKTQVMNLYKFIDWVIGLPQELEIEFIHDLHKLEGAKKMAYITNAERIGMEKGLKQGIAKGIEKGIAKGIEKGIEKGLEKGIKQGKELGKQEEREKVAIKMLKKETDLSYIEEITGLPHRRILQLKKQLQKTPH